MHKLVIFDCDGVLVDSEIIASQIDAELLTSYGYPLSVEECLKKFTGLSYPSVREVVFKEAGLELPEEYIEHVQSSVLSAFEDGLDPLMTELLIILEKRNHKRCVASSSARHRVLRSLELSDQRRFFEESDVFTSQQVERGKPAPDLFLFAASELGADPEDCLVIEDSPAGVEAALAARMSVIGFVGGSHARYGWYRERLRSYGVPVVEEVSEIFDLIMGSKQN